jgi:flagellar P-ring protein precursor FlgI
MRRGIIVLVGLMMVALPAHAGTRIKDIISVKGVRANQLVGYGLVIGLNGTGDSLRNSPFTEQSIQSMLDRMGVNLNSARPRSKNVAGVIVTAELPAFSGKGSRIDVTVSSLGDATSLQGGTLIMTPLSAADNEIYAVAQGPIAVTGFAVQGRAESLTQGVPTAGRVANGALVEREVAGPLADSDRMELVLRNPDFGTAIAMVDAINKYSAERFGQRVAREKDLNSVELKRPAGIGPARFMAEIGDLVVQADAPARVVIDERTGTIVIGRDVQVSTVAVTHGNLTVRVTESAQVSQPEAFSDGETVVVPETTVGAQQQDANIAIVKGTNLQVLVNGLNQMGLKPNGIIAILQAIKSAGALQAELVVQ